MLRLPRPSASGPFPGRSWAPWSARGSRWRSSADDGVGPELATSGAATPPVPPRQERATTIRSLKKRQRLEEDALLAAPRAVLLHRPLRHHAAWLLDVAAGSLDHHERPGGALR